jgi:ferrous iron transport protein A
MTPPSPDPISPPGVSTRHHPRTAQLSDAPLGQLVSVAEVRAPAGAPEWAGQLSDLGFVPGEPVQLMARGLGGDPLVVRVGHSTYALRRAEAACVWIVNEDIARA